MALLGQEDLEDAPSLGRHLEFLAGHEIGENGIWIFGHWARPVAMNIPRYPAGRAGSMRVAVLPPRLFPKKGRPLRPPPA